VCFITTDISLFPMPWVLIEVVGWVLEAAVAICILELGLCC